MPVITKKELIEFVTDKLAERGTKLTRYTVGDIVQLTIDEITSHLSNGDSVVMRRFGSFHAVVTKAKIGRNPKAPETDVPIPARARVKFKPSPELKVVVESAHKKRKKHGK